MLQQSDSSTCKNHKVRQDFSAFYNTLLQISPTFNAILIFFIKIIEKPLEIVAARLWPFRHNPTQSH